MYIIGFCVFLVCECRPQNGQDQIQKVNEQGVRVRLADADENYSAEVKEDVFGNLTDSNQKQRSKRTIDDDELPTGEMLPEDIRNRDYFTYVYIPFYKVRRYYIEKKPLV